MLYTKKKEYVAYIQEKQWSIETVFEKTQTEINRHRLKTSYF